MLLFIFGVIFALILFVLILYNFGFLSQKPEFYSDQAPPFDIQQRLQGDILCEGLIYGPLGRVSSRFVAEMHAEWDGDTGIMTEDFKYDSGSTQNRIWTLSRPDKNGRFTATAPDLIGTGQGQQNGSAVMLRYKIKLPNSAGGHILSVVDWMYLMENGTIINRSQMRKYGIKVAELIATMRKI